MATVSSTVELLVKAQQPQRALRALTQSTDKLKQRVDATQGSFTRTGKAATSSASSASSAYRNLGTEVSGVNKTVRGLRNAFVALGGAVSASGILQTGVDAIESERRIKLLTMSTGDSAEALALASRAASRFGLSSTEANEGVARLLARLKPMGLGLDDIESTFSGFNIAAKLAGATASESAGAFLQLTQALGSGVLRGQELNSILEQAPLIATAIALEMNTTTGSLKKLGEEGKITSQIVLAALKRVETDGAEKLEEAMKGPAQQFKNLRNQGVELAKVLTENVLPAILPLVQGATDLLKSFNELDPGIQGFIVSTALAGTAVLTLTKLVGFLAATKLGAFLAQQAALFQVFGAKIYFSAAAAGALKIAMAALPFTAATLALGFFVNKLIEANRKQREFNELVSFGSEETLKAAIAKRIETRTLIENTIAKLENQAASISKFGEDVRFGQITQLKQDLKDLDKEFAELSLKLMDLLAARRKGATVLDPPGKDADKAADMLQSAERKFELLKEESDLGKKLLQSDFRRADALAKINKLENISKEQRQDIIDATDKAFDAERGSLIGEALAKDLKAVFDLKEAQEDALLPLQQEAELLKAKLAGNEEEILQKQMVADIMGRVEGLNKKDVEDQVAKVFALRDQVTEAEKLEQLYTEIGRTIETAIVDSLLQAKSASEALGSVLSAISRQLMTFALGSIGGSEKNSGSGIFGAVADIFRANGGPVKAGRSYIVGERGPEVFTPGVSGGITPNHAMGGANVTVNVDATGSSVEGNADQASQLGNAIGAAVQAELIKQKRPGGLLAS